jgi:hypothetical protein
MNKPKNKKSKHKQPDALHEALGIPKYEKLEHKDGTAECKKCRKTEKECKC